MLYRLGEHEPITDGEFYVADSATVLGKVRLCKMPVYGLGLF